MIVFQNHFMEYFQVQNKTILTILLTNEINIPRDAIIFKIKNQKDSKRFQFLFNQKVVR